MVLLLYYRVFSYSILYDDGTYGGLYAYSILYGITVQQVCSSAVACNIIIILDTHSVATVELYRLQYREKTTHLAITYTEYLAKALEKTQRSSVPPFPHTHKIHFLFL